MQDEESLYPADWIRIAEKDLRRVHRLLDHHDPGLAGFCLQQAVEKFFKAFLLVHGWQLRRIHSLDALLDDAITFDTSLEAYRTVCQKISAFYFLERYPLVVGSGATDEDVRTCLEQVGELIDKLRTKTSNK